MTSYETIIVERGTNGVATITMNRPAVRNAFNAQLIDELEQAFLSMNTFESTRVVVLRGAGDCFCAGADLNWMKASADLSLAENEEGARLMACMFRAISDCTLPVIGVIHGHALGGGAGLVGAVDIALVADEAKLGFTEVRLGIIPAVISPFVLRKVSETHARRYFLSGEVFGGQEAERIGLAQKSMPRAEIEAECDKLIESLLQCGPKATGESKRLITEVKDLELADAIKKTAPWIAKLRASKEGQEGMDAFLNKRRASWVETKK
ncbi:MAG: methylglutaconyl-CoA hydratase [Planctomycetota bacterium]|jgi:methylglutaconyl-CoA hydratase